MSTPIDNDVSSEFILRLRRFLADKGTQRDIVAKTGIKLATLQRILAGTSPVKMETLQAFAEAYDVSPAWLLHEPSTPIEPAAPLTQFPVRSDVIEIREVDLAYGMGGSFIDDVESSEVVRQLPKAWVRTFTRAAAEHLFLCHGTGDSMMPTLLDSDILLVDRSQSALKQSDRLWVLAIGDVGMVKRVRVLPDGNLLIMSDNSYVPDMTAVDGEAAIIGRVVAIVRKM